MQLDSIAMNVIYIKFLAESQWVNGWQLAKMKKSIPDMSLPWNL